MENYWKLLWQRLSAHDGKVKAEVERIALLQQTASVRRAEYAEAVEKKQQAERAGGGDASPSGPLSSSRKRMEAAEAAHVAALQTWENKQARQKSR